MNTTQFVTLKKEYDDAYEIAYDTNIIDRWNVNVCNDWINLLESYDEAIDEKKREIITNLISTYGKITNEYTKLFEDVYEDMYNLQCKFLRHYMWSENVPNPEDQTGEQIISIQTFYHISQCMNDDAIDLPFGLEYDDSDCVVYANTRKERNMQQKFMNAVNELITNNFDLPKSFELFYRVETQHDRGGTGILVKPFLTKEKAHSKCKASVEWDSDDGKYGMSTHSIVVDSTNKCDLEYCLNKSGTKHEFVLNINNL